MLGVGRRPLVRGRLALVGRILREVLRDELVERAKRLVETAAVTHDRSVRRSPAAGNTGFG